MLISPSHLILILKPQNLSPKIISWMKSHELNCEISSTKPMNHLWSVIFLQCNHLSVWFSYMMWDAEKVVWRTSRDDEESSFTKGNLLFGLMVSHFGSQEPKASCQLLNLSAIIMSTNSVKWPPALYQSISVCCSLRPQSNESFHPLFIKPSYS